MRKNKKRNKIFSLSFLLIPGWFDGGWLGSAMLKTTSFGTKYNDQRGSGQTVRSRWELFRGKQSYWRRIWGRCRLGWWSVEWIMKMVGEGPSCIRWRWLAGWGGGGGGTADDVGQLAHDQPCNAPLLRICVLITANFINTSQMLRRN